MSNQLGTGLNPMILPGWWVMREFVPDDIWHWRYSDTHALGYDVVTGEVLYC